MLKWLTERFRKKPQVKLPPPPFMVSEYGRYRFKPILERALVEVTQIDRMRLVEMTNGNKIALNGAFVSMADLARRLESGKYEVICPESRKVWRFFIS